MAREKKPVHRVQMTEGKRNIHSPAFGRIRYPVSGRHPGCSERSSWWNYQRDDGSGNG